MLFQNLNEQAEKVISIASIESQTMAHYYVGTEHIFIGLLRKKDKNVIQFFQFFGIENSFEADIKQKIPIGNGPIGNNEMVVTPRMIQMAKIIQGLEKTFCPSSISPSFLLLGLLKAGNGVPVRLLKEKGVSIDAMISYMERVLTDMVEESGVNQSKEYLKQRAPILYEIGINLTELAREGKINPVIGRKSEIKAIARILSRRNKNNPMLLGEAGVGKTCVVEALACRLVQGNLTEGLDNREIISISTNALIAGTKHRGELEERLESIINEARSNPDIIVFIDEIHTLVGLNNGEGIVNVLKPALANGDIRCIGATTIDEYRRHIEKDPALERRFQIVPVSEPSKEETVAILNGLKASYEEHHKISISEKAILLAIELSMRHILDRHLPDKAIDIIDQACTRKRIKTLTVIDDKSGDDEIVEENDVAQVVSEWIGIPVLQLEKQEAEKMLNAESILAKRVIGQECAVREVAKSLRIAKAGLSKNTRPLGVFLFMGPTGVGKTELAKAITELLFDDEQRLIRYDMSEFKDSHMVSRLIGAPPGYIGHDQEGELIRAVRTHPYSVILFDEIEKAHTSIFDIFLQIFDEGRLTSSQGKLVDFRNTIIILSSNLGNDNLVANKRPIGFHENDPDVQETERYTNALSQTFRPEIIGRIDKSIVFSHLDNEFIRSIVNKRISELNNLLTEKGITLSLSDDVIDLLTTHGYSQKFGVRELDRVIQRYLSEPLSEEVLKNQSKLTLNIKVFLEDERLVFTST